MRALTAYFVGGGTIVAAIAVGLGGGIVAGNIMNPIAPRQGPDSSKLERRAEPAAATNAPSEHVQYLTGSQVFGAVVSPPAQAEAPADANTAKEEPRTVKAEPNTARAPKSEPETAKAAPQAPKAEPQTASTATTHETGPAAQPAKPAEQQASTEQSSSPENANAKAKDADVKRAASERRHAERRQRWAERRRYETRVPRDMRDRPDWDDIARNVREDADARAFAATPRRGFPQQSNGFPQIRLFGSDDDD